MHKVYERHKEQLTSRNDKKHYFEIIQSSAFIFFFYLSSFTCPFFFAKIFNTAPRALGALIQHIVMRDNYLLCLTLYYSKIELFVKKNNHNKLQLLYLYIICSTTHPKLIYNLLHLNVLHLQAVFLPTTLL